MTLSWTLLTPQQQRALTAMRAGQGGIDTELVEQLRNLGLAELGQSGVAVSQLGETIMPATLH